VAIESPLFQSSMELLGHSFSHFNVSEELDRKLVILHLANAVELILKDLVLDSVKRDALKILSFPSYKKG